MQEAVAPAPVDKQDPEYRKRRPHVIIREYPKSQQPWRLLKRRNEVLYGSFTTKEAAERAVLQIPLESLFCKVTRKHSR